MSRSTRLEKKNKKKKNKKKYVYTMHAHGIWFSYSTWEVHDVHSISYTEPVEHNTDIII